MKLFEPKKRECQRLLMIAAVIIVLQVIYIINDYLVFGFIAQVNLVALCRVAHAVIMSVPYFVFSRQLIRTEKQDVFLTVWTITIVFSYFYAHQLRLAYDPLDERFVSLALFIMYILLYWLLVPFRNVKLQALMISLYSTLYISTMHQYGQMQPQEYRSATVLTLLTIVAGAYINRQEAKLRKAEEEQLQARRREFELLSDKANLQVLCAQIKPHFLFNVIGTISTLCAIRPKLAEFMLDKFAVYLRNMVNVHREVVTLTEELETVASYLEIQKIRMSGRMEYEIQNQARGETLLPIFAVQTLVENAVLHGLKDCYEGGRIEICVASAKNGTIVVVRDNGAGTDCKELMRHLTDEVACREGNRSGVGLYNVHRRLLLTGSAGLQFESAPDNGVVVTFFVPDKNSLTAAGN